MDSIEATQVGTELLDRLRTMPLFKQMSDEDIAFLLKLHRRQHYVKGDLVVAEGDLGDTLYIILDGMANVTYKGKDVGALEAGECIGEISLAANGAHIATVVAFSDLDVVAVSNQDLRTMIESRPALGVQFYRNLAADIGQKLSRLNTWHGVDGA